MSTAIARNIGVTTAKTLVLAITVGLPCGLFGLDIAISAVDVGVVGQTTGYAVTSSDTLTAFSQTLYQEYFGVLQLIGLILAVPVVLAAGVVKQTQTRISKQQDSQAQLQVDVSERLSLLDPKQTETAMIESCFFLVGCSCLPRDGMIINRGSHRDALMCGMIFCLNINFVVFSKIYAHVHGQIMGLIVIVIAAAESAIALALMVLMYRQYHSVDSSKLANIRG